jgi:hypothetical protein
MTRIWNKRNESNVSVKITDYHGYQTVVHMLDAHLVEFYRGLSCGKTTFAVTIILSLWLAGDWQRKQCD